MILLTTEVTEKHIDNKIKTTCFYNFRFIRKKVENPIKQKTLCHSGLSGILFNQAVTWVVVRTKKDSGQAGMTYAAEAMFELKSVFSINTKEGNFLCALCGSFFMHFLG